MIENEYGPYVYHAHALRELDKVEAQLSTSRNLIIATHEHLLPLLKLYGEKPDHPVMQAISAYVATLTA